MGKSGAPSRKAVVLVGGAVGLLAGIGLLVWGVLPAREMVDAVGPAFNGGAPPDDLGERLDAAMAHLKARAWADGVGFVLLLAGFVAVKFGLARPAPSVEQLVQAEVARLAMRGPAVPAPAAAQPVAVVVMPAPAPAMAQSVPVLASAPMPAPPPPAPAARRTHCATCSSVLVAGGRICPQGHPQE